MVRVWPRQVCPVSNAHPDDPHPIPSPSSVSFAGMVYQVDGDYGARAGAAPGSVLPSKVNNIPAGAVVKDLIGGEAFAMAVLSTGIVYVRLRTQNIVLFSPMHAQAECPSQCSLLCTPSSLPPSHAPDSAEAIPHRTSSRLRNALTLLNSQRLQVFRLLVVPPACLCRYGWGAGTNGQLCRSSGYSSLTNNLSAGKVDSSVLFANGCGSEDYTLLLSKGAYNLNVRCHLEWTMSVPPHGIH
jgi:hypothetical protein